jgi:hypothetical protein
LSKDSKVGLANECKVDVMVFTLAIQPDGDVRRVLIPTATAASSEFFAHASNNDLRIRSEKGPKQANISTRGGVGANGNAAFPHSY